MRIMCKSKIHRAAVTEADLDYVGSITIDEALMDAADIMPYEKVLVVNLETGTRAESYAIVGERGSGVICANGGLAKLFFPGQKTIIIAFSICDEKELKGFKPKIVLVDGKNRQVDTAPSSSG